jgi:hypothetical protein
LPAFGHCWWRLEFTVFITKWQARLQCIHGLQQRFGCHHRHSLQYICKSYQHGSAISGAGYGQSNVVGVPDVSKIGR